jgi:hypothetical protein
MVLIPNAKAIKNTLAVLFMQTQISEEALIIQNHA